MTANSIACTSCGYEEKSLRLELQGMTVSVESAARTLGWRIWSGETVAGATAEHRLCPVCAGRATPEQKQEIDGWDAECDTCHLSMSEEYAEDRETDEPFTEKEARDWSYDHECEPSVRLIRPAKSRKAVA